MKVIREAPKVGDFISFIFGLPGPDITQMVVKSVSETKFIADDPFCGVFDVELDIDSDQWWPITERERNAHIELQCGHLPHGRYKIDDLLNTHKQKIGL